jgi:hypothetical protein
MNAVPPLKLGRVKRPVSLWRHHIHCENNILKKTLNNAGLPRPAASQ